VTTTTTPFFHLPHRHSPKADPSQIACDERHFATIALTLEQSIAELSERLAVARSMPGGAGQAALDRDLEVHRLTARLRTLTRYGVDLCLGRIVPVEGAEPIYVGRLGLTDSDGGRLLVDWRSPAAEPFFGATHAQPMGLASRRRYRWQRGRVTDYWDEVFTADGLSSRAALDDQSAFIASLASSRSERMREVLGTIQADQDAIVRAGWRGPRRGRWARHGQDGRRTAPDGIPALLGPPSGPPQGWGPLRRTPRALLGVRVRRPAEPG